MVQSQMTRLHKLVSVSWLESRLEEEAAEVDKGVIAFTEAGQRDHGTTNARRQLRETTYSASSRSRWSTGARGSTDSRSTKSAPGEVKDADQAVAGPDLLVSFSPQW